MVANDGDNYDDYEASILI